MSVLAIIAAGLSQAWNTLSLFAVVNSPWLLTTLGIGASPVLVQAGILAGIALLTVGVIVLSVSLVSKVCGKIFGAQPNSHLDLNGADIGDPQYGEQKKDEEPMRENIQELYVPAKPARQFSQNSQQLQLAFETAEKTYQASIPEGGADNSGDLALLEIWREAYQAWQSDFDLRAIGKRNIAAVQEAVEEKIPEKGCRPGSC